MTPKFSIIIPVYNSIKYMSDCVLSVMSQTFKNFEIILVNDGSSDGSELLCDSLGKTHEQIKVIHQENHGLSIARNNGLRQSEGEYIIFLDSDDYWNSNKLLEVASSHLSKHSVNLSIFGYERTTKRIKKNIKLKITDAYVTSTQSKTKMNYLLKKKLLGSSACNKIIKKSYILKKSLYFEESRLSEDIEWTYKLIENVENILVIPKRIYVYVDNPDSITSNFSQTHYQHLKLIVNRLIANYSINSNIEKRYLISYTSFQYGLLLFHSLCQENSKIEIQIIEEYLWLKKFEKNLKMKVFFCTYKIIKFKSLKKIVKKRVCNEEN